MFQWKGSYGRGNFAGSADASANAACRAASDSCAIFTDNPPRRVQRHQAAGAVGETGGQYFTYFDMYSFCGFWDNEEMDKFNEIKKIRQINLIALIEKVGSAARFCALTGLAESAASQCKSGSRNIGDAQARKFEAVLELPKNWMDYPHQSSIQIEDWERRVIQILRGLSDEAKNDVLTYLEGTLISNGPVYDAKELSALALYRGLQAMDKKTVQRIAANIPKTSPATMPSSTGEYSPDEIFFLENYKAASAIGRGAIDCILQKKTDTR